MSLRYRKNSNKKSKRLFGGAAAEGAAEVAAGPTIKVGTFNLLALGVSNFGTGLSKLKKSGDEVFKALNILAEILADESVRDFSDKIVFAGETKFPLVPEGKKEWTESLKKSMINTKFFEIGGGAAAPVAGEEAAAEVEGVEGNSMTLKLNEEGIQLLTKFLEFITKSGGAETPAVDTNTLEQIQKMANRIQNEKFKKKGANAEIGDFISKLHGEILDLSINGGFVMGSNDVANLNRFLSTDDFQDKLFSAKPKFISHKINEFFAGDEPAIMVCTEADMVFMKADDQGRPAGGEDFKKKMKVKYVVNGQVSGEGDDANSALGQAMGSGDGADVGDFVVTLPQDVNYIRVGDTKPYLQITRGSSKFNNKGNMSRVVLFKNCIISSIAAADTEFATEVGKLLGVTKTANSDVCIVNPLTDVEGAEGAEAPPTFDPFYLVPVHLKSTTKVEEKKEGKEPTKEMESEALLNLVKTLTKNKNVITVGDFNYPYFPEKGREKNVSMGFGTADSSESETRPFTKWTTMRDELGIVPIPNPNPNPYENGKLGYRLKERFNDKLGNDQMWGGKMDKRDYNTDFVSLYNKDTKSVSPKVFDTCIDRIPGVDWGTNHCPYVHIDVTDAGVTIDPTKSWLSDHGLISATYELPFAVAAAGSFGGGARSRKRRQKRSTKRRPQRQKQRPRRVSRRRQRRQSNKR